MIVLGKKFKKILFDFLAFHEILRIKKKIQKFFSKKPAIHGFLKPFFASDLSDIALPCREMPRQRSFGHYMFIIIEYMAPFEFRRAVRRGIRSVAEFCYVFFLKFRSPMGLHSS